MYSHALDGFSIPWSLHVGCHAHPSPSVFDTGRWPLPVTAYFCWGLYSYDWCTTVSTVLPQKAMNCLARSHGISMGFGYQLGVDLPGEGRGMIPNAAVL